MQRCNLQHARQPPCQCGHSGYEVQASKRMADPRWGERLGNDFEGNKKMFWKKVMRVRTGEQAREEMVKDVNGQILLDGVEVMRLGRVF